MFMRILLLSLTLLLVISAVPFALANSDCDFSYSNYARAVGLHDMGDYARALRHYRCALEEAPEDAIIPILIENLHEDIASAPSAWSRDSNAAGEPACNPPRNYAQLGIEAHDAGDDDLALIHLQCALLADPQNKDALYRLGWIYINRGDTRAARHYFNRAERASAKDSSDDEDLLTYLLGENAKPLLGDRGGEQYRPTSAESAGAPTAGADADRQRSEYLLVITTNRQDRRVEALKLVDMIYRGDYNELRRRLSRGAYLHQGYQATTSVYLLRKARAFDRAGKDIDRTLAETATRLGSPVFYELTFAARVSSKVEIMLASQSIVDRPIYPRIMVLDDAEDRSPADRAGELEREPTRLDLRCELGQLYAAQGDYAAAFTQFYPLIRETLGDHCHSASRRKATPSIAPKASESASVKPAQAPTKPVTAARVSPAQKTFAQGMYFLADGKRYMAANTFLETLELDPTHKEARCRLGAIYTEWANYGAALGQFDRVLQREPRAACAMRNRKKTLLDMLAMYLPLTVDDFFYHARSYVRLGEWKLARDAFIKGLEIDPARSDVRCELGLLHAQLGDERAALREFDHALLGDGMDSCAWSNREALLQRMRDG